MVLFLTEVPNSFPKSGNSSSGHWGVSLSSGFHPQANGQSERTNQDLEFTLWCVTASNPTFRPTYLLCMEYAHNSSALSQVSHPLRRLYYSCAICNFPLLFPLCLGVSLSLCFLSVSPMSVGCVFHCRAYLTGLIQPPPFLNTPAQDLTIKTHLLPHLINTGDSTQYSLNCQFVHLTN